MPIKSYTCMHGGTFRSHLAHFVDLFLDAAKVQEDTLPGTEHCWKRL
jgi:hypothetical protein